MNDPLSALLASMTPEEREIYDTIQRAVAAGILTTAERVTLNQRSSDKAWVNDLRRRLTAQKSTHVRLMQ